MKRLCTLLFLCFCLPATAGLSKFDAGSRLSLNRLSAQSRAADGYMAAFVSLEDGSACTALEACGLHVCGTAGDIAIVRGTREALLLASELEEVRSVRLQRPVMLCNDLLRADIHSDALSSGAGVEGRTYTGEGVVTGLFDTGFDFRNPTFRDGSASRIKRVWHYIDDEGNCEAHDDANLIDALDTDDEDAQHGSHVLGTMSGHYDASPYDGVATGAEIAVACGPLSDVNIADGVSRIAAYARAEGKPCVINLSLADFIGPADGTDEVCRSLYASTAGAGDAILVMSAGNESSFKRSISSTLSAEDPALRTFILADLHRRKSEGIVSVWSGDSRPLKLKLAVMEMFEGTVLSSFEVPLDEEHCYSLLSEEFEGDLPEGMVCRVDEGMALAFEGSFATVYYSANSATNSRPNFYIDYKLSLVRATNPSGSKALGIIVEGAEGQRVDVRLQGDDATLYSAGRQGWASGADDFTISSMACTEGAVCVGSYNTRREWTALNGEYSGLGDSYPVGGISPWSSYGVTADGRSLPHVAAPGAAIVSVKSTPYIERHDNAAEIVYSRESDGRTDYWGIGYGTSMASPAVAGGIALWLEADPSLTAADVHEIIAATSRREAAMSDNPVVWGAGKFDAEAGLREVLARRAGIAGPSVVGERLLSWCVAGSSLELVCAGVSRMEAALYDMSGRKVASASAFGDSATMDIAGVGPGVYVLRAAGESVRIVLR